MKPEITYDDFAKIELRVANVLAALRVAAERGAVIVGFTGQTGGQMAPLCTHVFHAPHTSSDRIQEAHALAYHYICECVEAALA